MKSFSNTMRSLHRDLGYFVIGLTLIYAITGIVLSGRGLGWFKLETKNEIVIEQNIASKDFNKKFIQVVKQGKLLEIFPEKSYSLVENRLKLRQTRVEENISYYEAWRSLNIKYDKSTGNTSVRYKGYPIAVEIFLDAHKASHESAWFYLAIIYSVILAFLAISSFWMVKGRNGFKRRGIYLMLAGFIVVGIFLYLS